MGNNLHREEYKGSFLREHNTTKNENRPVSIVRAL
jgi:hypothetical protein